MAAAIGPDDSFVVTAYANIAQVWDVATGRRVGPPIIHDRNIWPYSVAVSPDGTRIATGGNEGVVQIRSIPPPPIAGKPARLRLWIQVFTGLELTETGAVRLLDPEVWNQRREALDTLGGPPVH